MFLLLFFPFILNHVGEKQMLPYVMDCLIKVLAHPLSPVQASTGHTRTTISHMPSPVNSDIVTSATSRPYDQGLMLYGSSVKPVSSSSSSASSSIPAMSYHFSTAYSAGNTVGNGCSGGSSVSNTLLTGNQPLVDERSYSMSSLLESDLDSIIPSDFTSSTILTSQSENCGGGTNVCEGLTPSATYGNGRVSGRNSNMWEIKHQVSSGASKNGPAALEVIVKPVYQSFTDLNDTTSFNRSPTSEAPSSGPLSSPCFLEGMRHQQYPSPSPDPGLGTGMMYPAPSTEGMSYSSSGSQPSVCSTEYLLYRFCSSDEQLATSSGLVAETDQDIIQGLPPPYSSSSSAVTVPNFLSRINVAELTDQEILPDIQASERSNLSRLHLVPNLAVNNNNSVHNQIKDDSSTASVWGSETREGNLIYRPEHTMSSFSQSGAHGISGSRISVARLSMEPAVIDNNVVSSTKPETREDVEARSSSMSISQLIGGAMKIEPDEWMHYSDHQ